MNQPALRQKPNPPSDLAPEVTQRAASDPKTSVWVGASAGSGKTKILTDRVMRLLLEDVASHKILCLTFTRAAAAEMAIRLTSQLSLWATCSEDELRESLYDLQGKTPTQNQLLNARRLFARVLSCPGGMRIRTIHAFCQEILGRFPVEAGLPPHFAVIEENDARELIAEVQTDLLHELQNAPQHPLAQALSALALDLGERGFNAAIGSIFRERARLDQAIRKAGGFEKLVVHLRDFLELAPGETGQAMIREAVEFAILPQVDLRQAATWLLEGTKSYVPRGEKILSWLALMPEQRATEFEAYCRCFLNKDGEAYAKFGDKELLQKYPDLDRIAAREATRLQSVRQRIEAAGIARTTESVLRLGIELNNRYEKRKAAQAALDYDDLIIRTDRLLHRPGIAPWVLYKLDGGLDHILVDEAQDTSRAQWSIIKALADEFFGGIGARDNTKRTLFAVGDEKQSIFSFQDADPDAFAEMRNYFARRLQEAGSELRSIPMHVSFRSAPAILKAVDEIFSQPQAQEGVSSEPIRHSAARPRAGETEKIGRVEVWPLCSATEKNKDVSDVWDMPIGYEDEHDPQAELAAMIAEKIAHWDETKEISPGDIMILLRNRGRFADLIVRALKLRGVPVTGVDRMHLTQQLPVMDLLALMQFALLPEDDLNLATVLRGPLLGGSEEQLMMLAIARQGSLWDSLKSKSQKDPAFAAMHDYLSHALKEADFVTPLAFLTRILNEACPGSDISGRRALWERLGPDALDPLEELLNAAQDFGARHAPSLQAFLHWIIQADAVIKRELDRGGGQVRIMTVHGAKGLEAPVVFLPDMTGVPRTQNVPKLLWNGDEIPLYVSHKPESGAARRLWAEARQKQMEEYRRLLYVALTRAANRLYIGGWESKKEKIADECWYKLVKDALQPLHEPAALPEGMPQPVIAFADMAPAGAKRGKSRSEISPARIGLPEWTRREAPAEPEVFRNMPPSHILPSASTPDHIFARGRIIHRLLQSLPDIEHSKRSAVAARFLANPQNHLTPEQQKDIHTEVLKLFEDAAFAPLFGPDSRAEVPMTGFLDGQTLARQVDRLYLQNDEIWIVDYKTNRPSPATAAETPAAYRQQLAEYRAILQNIYPGKTVRCFLLWTSKPELMELPERVLL